MSEGFNDENPVTRGRRNPEISAMLEAESEMRDTDQHDESDMIYVGLFPGDVVLGKVTIFAKTQLGDAWFTSGTQSHVADGETSDAAFERVRDVITTEVVKLGTKQMEVIESIQEQEPEAPRTQRRIVPR